MATKACLYNSPSDLLNINTLPPDNLTDVVSACFEEICRLVYGPGNPDLAGTGVITSYAIQIALAVLFGPAMMLDLVILPLCLHGYSPKRFSLWIAKQHEMCLWSQVLFFVAVSIASCVQQYQSGTFVYQNAVMIHLVSIVSSSCLSTASAFFFPVKKLGRFFFLLVVGHIMAAFTCVAPFIRHFQFDHIFRVCMVEAGKRKLVSESIFLQPYYHPFSIVRGGLAIIIIGAMVFLWTILRRRGPQWKPEEEKLDEFRRKDSFTKGCVLVMFALSIGLLMWSSFALYRVLHFRQDLFSFWDGKTGEEVWGFGQVSALFVWAPLLAELGDPAFTLLGTSLRIHKTPI
ncbi:hypothetical protein BKA66DRAFT_455757 [Pyrenochaeta sp. MPI-SDFR-AT-0127]|nr:hypothetical protein BKA66DRAFT_455757 [Pyrenochaeta sp. MPI-SDFR-AT-0127]